uniref:MAPEG family protein n=1 Tax=Sexangularia sp. CB-2014 TaxID=1486929 RepID=A0A7S1VRL3_9EUKA
MPAARSKSPARKSPSKAKKIDSESDGEAVPAAPAARGPSSTMIVKFAIFSILLAVLIDHFGLEAKAEGLLNLKTAKRQAAFVGFAVWLTGLVMADAMLAVARARMSIGLQYPAVYAAGDDAESARFNRIQRAHQNTLENIAMHFATLYCAYQRAPVIAALGGIGFALGRKMFHDGYAVSVSSRQDGAPIRYLSMFVLQGFAALGWIEVLAPGVLFFRQYLP